MCDFGGRHSYFSVVFDWRKLNPSKVITETSFHYGFILNAELIQSVFSGKGIQIIKFLYSCKKREIFIRRQINLRFDSWVINYPVFSGCSWFEVSSRSCEFSLGYGVSVCFLFSYVAEGPRTRSIWLKSALCIALSMSANAASSRAYTVTNVNSDIHLNLYMLFLVLYDMIAPHD